MKYRVQDRIKGRREIDIIFCGAGRCRACLAKANDGSAD